MKECCSNREATGSAVRGAGRGNSKLGGAYCHELFRKVEATTPLATSKAELFAQKVTLRVRY